MQLLLKYMMMSEGMLLLPTEPYLEDLMVQGLRGRAMTMFSRLISVSSGWIRNEPQ
jgi:hypothetical protein